MLEIKNLCFSVETENGTSEILKNLNLTIPDGKFVVITGPNGGGKSTLAKLIMGLEKPRCHQVGRHSAGSAWHQLWIPAAPQIQGHEGKRFALLCSGKESQHGGRM